MIALDCWVIILEFALNYENILLLNRDIYRECINRLPAVNWNLCVSNKGYYKHHEKLIHEKLFDKKTPNINILFGLQISWIVNCNKKYLAYLEHKHMKLSPLFILILFKRINKNVTNQSLFKYFILRFPAIHNLLCCKLLYKHCLIVYAWAKLHYIKKQNHVLDHDVLFAVKNDANMAKIIHDNFELLIENKCHYEINYMTIFHVAQEVNFKQKHNYLSFMDVGKTVIKLLKLLPQNQFPDNLTFKTIVLNFTPIEILDLFENYLHIYNLIKKIAVIRFKNDLSLLPKIKMLPEIKKIAFEKYYAGL